MNWWAFQVARTIYQSDIFLWKPARWFKVWIYLLWSVNHTDSKQFNRWQWRFTYEKIYNECNLWAEWVKKNAIKNVISRMKNQWNLTTQKTTRWFIITIVKYNDYQTLDNYKNHTEKKLQRTHKEHTNHTIIEEWKNDKNDKWTLEQKEYVRKNYPHARKGKKQDTIKNFSSYAPELVIGMVNTYKREVQVWLQDAKYVPASERRSRDFVAYSDVIKKQKDIAVYKLLLEKKKEMIPLRVEDVGKEYMQELYELIQNEKHSNLLSALQK